MVRRLTYLLKTVIFIVSLLLLSSCGEKYCGESSSSMPLVGVYALGTPPREAMIESLTVYGVGQVNDSILYNKASKVSTFYTPLNISTDMVKYVLCYENPQIAEQFKRDTLTYKYSKKLVFESPECGATYSFVIKDFKYTTHSISYAELVTPEVNSLESQTVKIYYAAED